MKRYLDDLQNQVDELYEAFDQDAFYSKLKDEGKYLPSEFIYFLELCLYRLMFHQPKKVEQIARIEYYLSILRSTEYQPSYLDLLYIFGFCESLSRLEQAADSPLPNFYS